MTSQMLVARRGHGSARAKSKGIIALEDLPLYAFVASIPFETVGTTSGVALTLTVARVFGIVWVIWLMLQGRLWRFRCHRVVALGALFVLCVITRGLAVNPGLWPEVTQVVQTLIQMVLLLWLVTNVVRVRPKLYEGIAWVYGLSCAALAILQVLGVTTYDIGQDSRVSGLSEDPNTFAGKLGIGLVLLIGLGFRHRRTTRWITPIVIALCPFLVLTIIRSGSRGGLIALFVGLSFLILPRILLKGNLLSRIAGIAVAAVLVGLVTYSIGTSETVAKRWNRTFEKGDMATREVLYPRVLSMIGQKPVFGWGPAENYHAAGEAIGIGRTQSTENTILWSLSAVGIVGSIPFFYVLTFAFISAWRLRPTLLGWVPVASLTSMMTVASTIEWYHHKVFWLIIGITIGAVWNPGFIPSEVRIKAMREVRLRS